jgi:hypothetical protein
VSSPSLGSLLLIIGLVLVVIGLLVSFGGLGWFGRLPGDVRVERESMRVYIPFASMIVVSIVLSLILYFARRFF